MNWYQQCLWWWYSIKFLWCFVFHKNMLKENKIHLANLSSIDIFIDTWAWCEGHIERGWDIFGQLAGDTKCGYRSSCLKDLPRQKDWKSIQSSGGKKEIFGEKFILLETEADEAVMGWFSQIAVSEFFTPENWLLSYGAVFPCIKRTTIKYVLNNKHAES